MTVGAYTQFLGSRPRNDVGFCRCHFNGGLVVQGVVCPKFRTMCRSILFLYIPMHSPFFHYFLSRNIVRRSCWTAGDRCPLNCIHIHCNRMRHKCCIGRFACPAARMDPTKKRRPEPRTTGPCGAKPPFEQGSRCAANLTILESPDSISLTRVFRIPRPDRPRPRPRPRRRPLIFDDFDLRKSSLSLAPPPRLRLRLHLRPRSNASPRLTAWCLSLFPGAPDPPSHLDDCIARHPDDL